jgi:hypothetical protein
MLLNLSTIMRHFAQGLCLVVCLVCMVNVVSAQPETPEQQALRLLKVGRELFDRGDFKGALSQFEAAYDKTRSWKLLIYIGVAQNRANQYCDALASLQRYLKEGGDTVSAAERASVEQELKTIHALRAQVEVAVNGPPGAIISVDGRARGKTPLERALCLEVGKPTISAALPGYITAKKKLKVEPHGKHRLVLTLEREKGLLRIESSPPGARLWLDDSELGEAPQKRTLIPGEYRIKAQLEGYLPRQEKVLLDARGRVLTLSLVARPPPPAPPWYKRWYWWTAIGAVVTAGVVAVTVYALQPDYIIVDGDERKQL